MSRNQDGTTVFAAIADVTSSRLLLALILITAVAFISQLIYRGYQKRRFYRDLPGPPHSWFWGHLRVIGEIAALLPCNSHPQLYFTEIARKYELDGIFYLDLWPFGPASVILTNSGLLDEVTVTRPLGQHPIASEFLTPIAGEGVFAVANGPLWKKMHRAISPAFSWTHIRHVTGIVVEETMTFRSHLDQHAINGDIFSMEELAANLLYDVFGRILFNSTLNAQTTGSQDLSDLQTLVRLGSESVHTSANYNPLDQISRWWKRRQITPRIDASIMGKINERFDLLVKGELVPSKRNPNSILDLMLREYVETTREEDEKSRTPGLSKADKQLLVTNVKALLIGGHGTTTDSLCYIYMLLSKAPGVVDKLCQEHVEQFGNEFNGAMETLLQAPEKLQSLDYTEAVIKEALRLFPIGFGVRQAAPGATLSYAGRDLPVDNGLAVSLNSHDLHYNSRYFSNPSEFRPERWLDPDREIPRSYFRTFGRGMRACLGQNLAMKELKIFLLATVGYYTFECARLEPNLEPRTRYTDLDTRYGDVVFQEIGLEAKPRGGMMLKVTKRP